MEEKMSENAGRPEKPSTIEIATFAGGCFWCMQPPFDNVPGVIETKVGYTGGEKKNPSYEQVCTGKTGHAEAVEVHFDPEVVDYRKLLEVFWRNIDPTTENRQFADRGSQYRTAIFYHNDNQKRLAEQSKRALAESGMFDAPIVTEIVSAGPFYEAEEYHQNYYQKQPGRYKSYKIGSGRAGFLEKTHARIREQQVK
ncbi:MAG: peptide-methionine (S)-S-oxide reductase MsrA [Chitinivibrionales bacterium]|nr:peptide-methionine (S)-S-oxide reductase MsrA [Chitinivibrionales bacterium]MBD3358817.1 peptide-methionine (S)-S-oxide reductase MsrA [Chitinivibrionales bacterium]